MRQKNGTTNVLFWASLVILVFLVGCSNKDESLVAPEDTPEGATYVAFEVHRNSLAVTGAAYTNPRGYGIDEALIAVGLEGRALLYPNDDFATPLILQSTANFRGIFYKNEDQIIICGDRENGSAVVRLYDGDGWLTIPHSATGNIMGVSNSFFCSDAGEILELLSYSTGLGPVFQAPPGVAFNDIYQVFEIVDIQEVIAVGDDGAIFHRYVGGEFVDESVPGGPDFIAISGLKRTGNPLEALAVSSNDIWQFREGAWNRVYHDVAVNLNSIQHLTHGAMAVGDGGLILRSDGADWTVESLSEDVDIVAVALSANYGITGRYDICGSQGEVFRAEGTWRNLNHHASGPWSAFFTTGDGTRYAANGNKLMRFVGDDWVEFAVLGMDLEIGDFHVVDPAQVWVLGAGAGGFDNYVLFYNGSDWSMMNQSSLDGFNAIWCDANGDNVFVAADRGQIWWHHGGLLEMAVDLGISGAFNDLAGTGMEDLLAVGDSGLIMRRGPGGWSEESSGTTNTLRSINGSLAAGDGGTILQYGGSAWKAVGPDFNARYNGVWYGGAADIWAVGEDASVMHYDGTDWTRLLTDLPGIDFLAVTGAGDGKVWIGGSEGYLLRSPQ